MKHLINPFSKQPIDEVTERLKNIHHALVKKSKESFLRVVDQDDIDNWGSYFKRLSVNTTDVDLLVGSSSQKLIEIINILATVERTIDALIWLQEQSKYSGYTVHVCHPSTSDSDDETDIMLADGEGRISVMCEVTDVVNSNAGQNNKEKKSIMKLGCINEVPQDDIDRYIVTEPTPNRWTENGGK